MPTPKIPPNSMNHFILSLRPTTPHGITLDILIQIFIRIQLWAVTGKMENLNRILMFLQPLLHPLCLVNRMLIQDQIYPPTYLPNQTPEKIQEDFSAEPPLENHEINLTAVGNRRNHATTKALSRPKNHRGFAPTTIRPPTGMIRSHPHLVSPINLGFFPFGRLPNLRIVYLQPSPNLFLVLLKRTADRFLWREAPLGQIPPHRPNGKPNPKPLGHQGANSLPRPQEKGKLQLIRATILDRPHNLSCLPRFQRSPFGPSPTSGPKGSFPSFPVFLEPLDYRLTGNPKKFPSFFLGHAIGNSPDRFSSEVFLGNRWKRTCIFDTHASRIS